MWTHIIPERGVFLSKVDEWSPAGPWQIGLSFLKLNPVHSAPGADLLLQSTGCGWQGGDISPWLRWAQAGKVLSRL